MLNHKITLVSSESLVFKLVGYWYSITPLILLSLSILIAFSLIQDLRPLFWIFRILPVSIASWTILIIIFALHIYTGAPQHTFQANSKNLSHLSIYISVGIYLARFYLIKSSEFPIGPNVQLIISSVYGISLTSRFKYVIFQVDSNLSLSSLNFASAETSPCL